MTSDQAGYHGAQYDESGAYEGEDGYFYDQDGNYLEGYTPGDHQIGYDNSDGDYNADGGYYDDSGNLFKDEGYYYDDSDGANSRPNSNMKLLTFGNEVTLKNALDELGDDDDDYDDDNDYDDETRPVTRESGRSETARTGDSVQDEITRTRERLGKMNLKPLEVRRSDSAAYSDSFINRVNISLSSQGGQKKWGLLRGVKNVLNEVNEAGKLHDEDLVMEEELVAVCSLLANKAISLVVGEVVPKVAMKIKKEVSSEGAFCAHRRAARVLTL